MVIDMYPAHILESGEVQTVREHCRSTAELAARALRPIGLTQSAYLDRTAGFSGTKALRLFPGQAHQPGKANHPRFQKEE